MSANLVRQTIRAFLQTPIPEVLCISGRWGVGKTFIWNEEFKQSKMEKKVALPYYCCVSLFGTQSIDEIRQAVFENRVTTKKVEIEPTFESVKEAIAHGANLAGKQISKAAGIAKLPILDKYLNNFSVSFRQVVSLSVRDTIICFDDLERKSISTRDLLGLVSLFREQQRCKIVIIMNEDELPEKESNEFRKYFEKVVDIYLTFSPTPDESADIALKGDSSTNKQIRQRAITLKINNVRILNRIRQVTEKIMGVLEHSQETTKSQAIHTVALLVWSKYDEGAVPTKFIQDFHHWSFLEKNERTDEEKIWLEVLKNYKFSALDDFDLVIKRGLDQGFFDWAQLKSEAEGQDRRQAVSESRDAIYTAWRKFHGSFEDNADEVVDKMYSVFKSHMQNVPRGNLDQVLGMFRTLGYDAAASELISAYIAANESKITAIDDTASPYHPVVTDQEFRTALELAVKEPPSRPVAQILADLSRGKSIPNDIQVALRLSEDELYNLFKGLKGDEIDAVIEGSLFYRRVSNAEDNEKQFTQRAMEALRRIGEESALNAMRIGRFSISVEEKQK
jgi:hypothetical protein